MYGKYYLPCTILQIYYYLSTLLACEELKSENHLQPAMRLIQTLCRKWSQDAEASSFILLLLKGTNGRPVVNH